VDLDLYILKRRETQVINYLDHKMESRLSILGIDRRLLPVIVYTRSSQYYPISVTKNVP